MKHQASVLFAVCGLLVVSLLGGCSEDAICGSGEYPVAAVRSAGGGDCIKDGQEPTSGYVRYPKDKVPEHVDDRWDKYWQHHMLDEKGNEMIA